MPSGGGKGSGHTSIDTPSMELFAANMDKLIEPVQAALDGLSDVSVAPGGFYHANLIRTNINGLNADGGLKASFQHVLSDLVQGLSDTRDTMKSLSVKYINIEDANKMKAADLQQAMQSAQADFDALNKDGGGGSSPS
ncbi:hypothetical protein ACGFYV_36990 [Streptomyces sp. NPDC048297]|uniref:hypothetical protein n=1 Tax=Streptomyces sp. NPDC048297 TaxID=3365531 RepID=UPI003722DBDC